MTHYKFVNWDVPEFETVLGARIPHALQAWDNGDKEPLKELHIVTTEPVFRQSGWAIPFYEYMNRYWVKTKYNGIIEVFALNKLDIRKELKSNIIEIIKV